MNFAQITTYMTTFWAHIWRLTTVTLPIFNITIGEFLIGLIIVNISVIILRSELSDYFSSSPFKSNVNGTYIPRDSHSSKQTRTGGSL